MIFHQLRPDDGTGTLMYFIADTDSGDAAVIDPTIDGVDDVLRLLDRHSVRLLYVIDTHTHADHLSGAARLREECGARLIMHEKTRTKVIPYDLAERIGIAEILRENEKTPVDIHVSEGDIIEVGGANLHVLHTPGHTDNHMSLKWDNRLFTGDLLLIGQAGRSDLPGGNPRAQFEVFQNKILAMDDETIIYPGHDYAGNVNSTLGYERLNDEFLKKQTFEEFEAYIRDFFPPVVEMGQGQHATLQCGVTRVQQDSDHIANISATELANLLQTTAGVFLLDVREEFELLVFGKIPGVHNIPRGQLGLRLGELPKRKDAVIITVCQSGNRSYEAAFFLRQQGYTDVRNLMGGTISYLREVRQPA